MTSLRDHKLIPTVMLMILHCRQKLVTPDRLSDSELPSSHELEESVTVELRLC